MHDGGQGLLIDALKAAGFRVDATAGDFFDCREKPDPRIDGIVTNPPYGAERGGRLAESFIRHAFTFDVRLVAMLLRVDFDSAKTRADLFRDNKIFAGKIVLVDRIKWFKGPSQPSDNHAWFLWDRKHRGWPSIAYAGKRDADKAA